MATVDQVVFVVIDGMRSDGLQRASTPNVDRLLAGGAHTFAAQSVLPCGTHVCHASMFYGVPPEVHGMLDPNWPSEPPVPSVTDILHEAGKSTAHFFTWEQLRYLSRPGSLDLLYAVRIERMEEMCDVAETAAAYITTKRPEFAFVYFEGPDVAGHSEGWMSAPYLQAISLADEAVGVVMDAVERNGLGDSTAFLLLADHGGHGKGHPGDSPEDLNVPWILSGPGVRAGYEIQSEVRLMDTAPTVAHLLGVEAPAEWRGRVVAEAPEP